MTQKHVMCEIFAMLLVVYVTVNLCNQWFREITITGIHCNIYTTSFAIRKWTTLRPNDDDDDWKEGIYFVVAWTLGLYEKDYYYLALVPVVLQTAEHIGQQKCLNKWIGSAAIYRKTILQLSTPNSDPVPSKFQLPTSRTIDVGVVCQIH